MSAVETVEYAGMVRRMIRAHGRRAAVADPEDLADLYRLHQAVNDALDVAIQGQRDRGVSWDRIGQALGISRQAAQQKFRRPAQQR